MEDNSKLFVFDKKEVILIFVFMVLITITSFTLGVRFGKSLSLTSEGYTEKDVSTIDLKSVEEERVEKITDSPAVNDSVKPAEMPAEDEMGKVKSEDDAYLKETELRIREEINKLANPAQDSSKKKVTNLDEVAVEETPTSVPAQDKFDELYRPEAKLAGKYTIQLASFETKDEAQSFADGFIASGYDAIINEVEIAQKGLWYRVSIGLFDNLNEAKEYLEKEQKFFQGKDYLIKKFK